MKGIFNTSRLLAAALAVAGLFGSLGAAAADRIEFVHTDALGSPVAVTDENGVVIRRTEYEPYGAVVGGEVADGPGYAGHVADSATGLSYMQQRYMDPELGVFLSVDPVTAYEQPVAQFGRYRYGNSNPYKFTDPDGRSATAALEVMAVPVILVTIYYTLPPEAKREIARSLDNVVKQGATAIKQKAEGLRQLSESGGAGGPEVPQSTAPALPTGLVGDQSSPLAGTNKSGNRHTSGNLAPEHGGTGDYDTDLRTLAGETRPAGKNDSAPPGAQIGKNGVFGRSPNSSGGKSIDIPKNGDKPHETLHY